MSYTLGSSRTRPLAGPLCDQAIEARGVVSLSREAASIREWALPLMDAVHMPFPPIFGAVRLIRCDSCVLPLRGELSPRSIGHLYSAPNEPRRKKARPRASRAGESPPGATTVANSLRARTLVLVDLDARGRKKKPTTQQNRAAVAMQPLRPSVISMRPPFRPPISVVYMHVPVYPASYSLQPSLISRSIPPEAIL